jgi:hypothetical protein
MYHIRNNAESSVRNLLRDVAKKLNTNILRAVDYLDDGSPACAPPIHMVAEVLILRFKSQICLQVEINENDGSAVFDFEGTGCEVRGNLNAPASVVHSAVIYCMRAMLDLDIPLNAGCLVPLDSRCYSSHSSILVQYLWQFGFPVAVFWRHHALRQSVEVMCSPRSASWTSCCEHSMLVPPVKGVRTILLSGLVVKTTRAAPSRDGVITRHVAINMSISVRMLIGHIDDRGWFGGGPQLAWNVRGAHAHNKYTYRRCRDTRETVPSPCTNLWTAPGLCWGREILRRRGCNTGTRILGIPASVYFI